MTITNFRPSQLRRRREAGPWGTSHGSRPVPAPFDDYSGVWDLLRDVGPKTTIRLPPQLGKKTVSQQYAAIPALPATAEADSLQAALDALVAAAKAHGPDYPRLFASLREDFPQLA